MHPRRLLIASGLALTACADTPTITEPSATASAVKFWEVNSVTRWNRRALDLVALRPPGNAQAATSRILTYVSLAQYRAVLAVADEKDGSIHPSLPAAIGAASVAVLSSFFPLDVGAIEAMFDGDIAVPGWPGAKNQDQASGESVGRAVGAEVVSLAAADNYLVVPTGIPPAGPGFWISAAAPIVRSLHGTRPFFLTSPDAIRAPPPRHSGRPGSSPGSPRCGRSPILAPRSRRRSLSSRTRRPHHSPRAR